MWLRNSHVRREDALKNAGPITSLMGTGMLVRREAALKVQGFGEEYFIYFEDHEFGTALFLQAGDLVSVPESEILHLEGTQDLSFRTGRRYPSRRAYLTAKNRVLFTLIAFEGRTLLALLPVLLLHELSQAVFSLAKGWIENYSAGLFWNVTHLGRTLRRREAFQCRRRRPDVQMMISGPLPVHPGLMNRSGILGAFLRGLEASLGALYRVGRPFLRTSTVAASEKTH
jgi:GT2 family glycosyltransferase